MCCPKPEAAMARSPEFISLPEPVRSGEKSLEALLQQCRSVREYQEAALDLVTVVVGAFEDDAVATVLKLPTDVQPLMLLPVARR